MFDAKHGTEAYCVLRGRRELAVYEKDNARQRKATVEPLADRLVLFWSDMLVSRVAGMTPEKTLKEPRRWRSGPITMPEATPMATPALSPLVIGTTVPIRSPISQVSSLPVSPFRRIRT